MLANEVNLREAIEKLARHEALSDHDLTLFCEAFFLLQLDRVFAAAMAAEVPAEEFDDLANAVVEELKNQIRTGVIAVEISPDGKNFRCTSRGATH